MDEYPRLKHLLDSLCTEMNLQSWTVHENQKGVVFTVRFNDPPHSNRATDVNYTEKWKKASASAIKRDQERMTRYNETKENGIRRSKRLESLQIETKRFPSVTEELHSDPDSPVSVSSGESDIYAQFQVNTQSPEACDIMHQAPTTGVTSDVYLASPDNVKIPPSPPKLAVCTATPTPELPKTEKCVSQASGNLADSKTRASHTPAHVERKSTNTVSIPVGIPHGFHDGVLPIKRQPYGPHHPCMGSTWFERKTSSRSRWLKPPD